MSTVDNTLPSREATLPPEGDASYVDARDYLDGLRTRPFPQTRCLSVQPHDLKTVGDLRRHFFGCLGIDRRIQVLENEDDPIWKQADKLEREDTELHRPLDAKRRAPQQRDEGDKRPGMRYITALNLQAELKRIAVLRRTPALRKMVRGVRASLNAWRDEKQPNVIMVGRKRADSTHFHSVATASTSGDESRSRGRSPEPMCRDTVISPSNRPENDDILPEFSRKLKGIVDQERTADKMSAQEEDSSPPYDLQRDIKARLIQLGRPKRSEAGVNAFMANVMEPVWQDIDEKIFKGTFPDQQVSIHHLFERVFRRVEGKSLAEKVCPSKLSYVHIPANNMIWVEQAMASYFGESKAKSGNGLRTKMVLQDSYWRGQQHDCGPDEVVHHRNLRPICEKISSDLNEWYHSGENPQKGHVLFMPYLHWETDRLRDQAADLIEQLEDQHDLDRRETAQIWKSKRKEDQKGLDPAKSTAPGMPADYEEPNYYRTRGKDRDQMLHTLAQMLWKRIRRDASEPMPPGLAHELWQRIRDEDYTNALLKALEKVIVELAKVGGIPPGLRQVIWEDAEHQHEMREWRDIVWRVKEAGQGYPTPHALADMLWEKIKEERGKTDGEEYSKAHRDQMSETSRSRRIFQKRTTILKGVRMDKYGQLQPKSHLAQVFVNAAKLYECIITYPDQQILNKYLFKNSSLHPRRTLDQAYFWRLRTTRLRDRDQVVYRYTSAEFAHKYRLLADNHHKEIKPTSFTKNADSASTLRTNRSEPEESRKWTCHGSYEQKYGCDQCTRDIRKVSRAIMVDQLWMWVLDKDTILTCFPQRYGASDKDPSGVHQSIRLRVKTRSNTKNHVLSIFDLALIILEECYNTFFDRTTTEDQRPQIMDMFSESIGRVTNQQAIAFTHLWTLSQRLTDIYESGVEDEVDSSILLALLNVTPEAELQREIRDIIDELDIILHIVHQQKEMINRFVKFAKESLAQPNADLSEKSVFYDKREDGEDIVRIMQQQYDAFRDRSDSLVSEIADRIKELRGLKSSAESTAQNVTELLSLKQQQASVVQTYESTRQGEETVRQGKAIMVFTVVTIIFLPLSFMSSLFGMNAVELTGMDPSPSASDTSGPLPVEIIPFWPITFKRQILIMFTVSFGAVVAIIIPAFSSFIRALISSIMETTIAKIITWTGMYRLWLKAGWGSKGLRDGARRRARTMEEDVRKRIRQQELIRSEIRDGVRSQT
ncbi:hypothetical protein VPNG_00044 [Cytospora leucostoma]|uniref:Ankyrin repeat protein n=1 Tax=Cytospora leucostoma TaxID=1230097 RepID=A0A423XNL6_9PEZI|nr:hypothetical protein VPNG_00044 [Cytospora leucostoma]